MKKILFIAPCLAALALSVSCKEEEGRVPDTGDLKMGIVMPGNESVTLCGTLKPGSGATKAEVTWGDSKSTTFDLASDGTFQQRIPVAEGAYIFRLSAYDAAGHKVIDFPMAGRSYGAAYRSGLKNRAPSYFALGQKGELNIDWTDAAGSLHSVVSYTKKGSDQPVTVAVASGDASTVLPDFDGEEFSVTSYYYPEMTLYNAATRPASVPEGFVYAEFAPMEATVYSLSGPTDVTSLYLKNAGPGIEAGERVGSKWGNPKDWKVTDNVRNQKENQVGGWSTDAGGVIHLETQNWSGPGYENGKVWQTVKLSPGTYRFTAHYLNGDGNAGVDIYVAAAKGSTLPDIEAMGEALAFKAVSTSQKGDYSIAFSLYEEAEVSLGLTVTLAGTEHWQQFSEFRLAEVPVLDLTSKYIANAGPKLAAAHTVGDKWGTPKDWSFTPNILNQEDNTVGGWSKDGGGVIHFETDHWSGPGFENGKLWQTVTLPAGTYAFVTTYGNAGNDYSRMNINLAVAAGAELPDIEQFATKALAYRKLDADGGRGGREHAVCFTLTESKKVSLGLVVTIAGQGEIYIQFNAFRLLSLNM